MIPHKHTKIEEFMLENQIDSVHDAGDVCRVLNYALDIASHEEAVSIEILYAACLLHDIGRVTELETDGGHAKIGGDVAYDWLLANGYSGKFAAHVRECIYFHSYRGNLTGGNGGDPSLEAKILYDADKLDYTGAMGIARALASGGLYGHPLYTKDKNGLITDEEGPSFLHEYRTKLSRIYETLHTSRAREIAVTRRETTEHFCTALREELESLS